MDNGVQRREWIKARIEAIRNELDELLHELSAPEAGTDEAEQRRRKFKFHKGGLGVLLLLLLSAAYLAASYRRVLVGVMVVAGAASVLAVAVFSHGAPRTNAPARAAAPPGRSASAVPPPSGRGASPRPTPDRTPIAPIVVPTRTRRTQEPIETPVGGPYPEPSPSPTLPAVPSPSASARPSISPSATPKVRCSGSALRIELPALKVLLCV